MHSLEVQTMVRFWFLQRVIADLNRLFLSSRNNILSFFLLIAISQLSEKHGGINQIIRPRKCLLQLGVRQLSIKLFQTKVKMRTRRIACAVCISNYTASFYICSHQSMSWFIKMGIDTFVLNSLNIVFYPYMISVGIMTSMSADKPIPNRRNWSSI